MPGKISVPQPCRLMLCQYQTDQSCHEKENIGRQTVVRIKGIFFPLHFFVGAGMEIFIMAFRNETFIKFRQVLGVGQGFLGKEPEYRRVQRCLVPGTEIGKAFGDEAL